MLRRRYSEQTKANVVSYALATTQAKASRKFGISKSTVWNWVHAQGYHDGKMQIGKENDSSDDLLTQTIGVRMSDLSLKSSALTVIAEQDSQDEAWPLFDSESELSNDLSFEPGESESDCDFYESVLKKSHKKSKSRKSDANTVESAGLVSQNDKDGLFMPVVERQFDDQALVNEDRKVEQELANGIPGTSREQRREIDSSRLESYYGELERIMIELSSTIEDPAGPLEKFISSGMDFQETAFSLWQLAKRDQLDLEAKNELYRLKNLVENLRVLVKVTKPTIENIDPSLSLMKSILITSEQVMGYILLQ